MLRGLGIGLLWLCAAAAATARAQELPGVPSEAARDDLAVVQVESALQAATEQLNAGELPTALRFADTFDWVRTASGEWVRGSIDWMREDIMEFDSDEFGPLEINMREVAEVHAAATNTYILRDRTELFGPAMIIADTLLVQTTDGVVVRPRADLWGIIEGGDREIEHWSLVVDLGIGMNRGNSNQADLNLRLDVAREHRRTLNELVYTLNLGYADRELNVTRHIVSATSRFWFTERWFVEPIVGQLLSDRFQDIRFRAQPAATAGVLMLYLPSRARWDLSVGPGYQYLRLFQPLTAVKNPQHDGLVRFATRARFDFTPDVYFTMIWVTNLTYTRVGNTNHTGIFELFFEATNVLNLQTTFLYLRTEEPPPRVDGTIPARNDYFLTLGVSLQLG